MNDPVLLHVEKNTWWMQLADSDAGLYALGVLASSGLDAQVTLPDVHPVQVQGPKAVKTLAEARRRSRSRPQVLLVRAATRSTGIPVADQPDRLDRDPGVRGQPAGLQPRRRALGRDPGGRRGVQHPSDRAVRGPPDRGGHLQLRLRHHARRHAVPRDGPRAPGRGPAAGLHRQGRAGAAPSRGRRPQAGRHHPGRATSCAPRCPRSGPSTRTARSWGT